MKKNSKKNDITVSSFDIQPYDLFNNFSKVDPIEGSELNRNPFGMEPLRSFIAAKPKSGKTHLIRYYI